MSTASSFGKKGVQLSKMILKSLYGTPGPYRPQIWSGARWAGISYVPQRKVSSQVYWDYIREQKVLPQVYRATVRRMKTQGWVIEAERQGKKFLKLTKKGKVQALLALIQENVGKTKPRWDGKWRVVIFDIPEKGGKYERYLIRNCLKSCGFHYLQKSVYIHPYEIPAPVIEYLRESDLLKFIRFLRVDKLDDSREMERRFQLRKTVRYR